ncbi:MAG: SDR family oxidoreductase [Asgard group archaeon]|nr:SDR family oxidoreductase [Asgard group archaeon]
MSFSRLDNKICLITGANSGIGKATTRYLVELGAHVVMVVRNKEKGENAIADIRKYTKHGSMELMLCDFAYQEQIHDLVTQYKNEYDQLDILVNNHGIYLSKKKFTAEHIQKSFAVNHLGYFLLTNLLLNGVSSYSPGKIINVSSGSYALVRKWPLDDYNFNKRKYRGFRAYAESKLYNIMFTYSLAKKLKESGITVNTYSPGFTNTNLGRNYRGLMKLFLWFSNLIAKSPEEGAKTAKYLAASPETTSITGKYFVDCVIQETSDLTYREDLQEELWKTSMKLTNL